LHEKLQKMIAEQMLKIIFALSAAVFGFTSCAHAQDTVAGESSFRKCLICHAIGENATNKIGPELNGLDGRKRAAFPISIIQPQTRTPKSYGTMRASRNISKDPNAKVPGTKMFFPASKTRRRPMIFGPTLNNSILQAA
jgi:cytochrome c